MKRGIYLMFKLLAWIVCIPIAYLLVGLMLTAIPVNQSQNTGDSNTQIYLSTNGVHLDVILPVDALSPSLRAGLALHQDTRYVGFGWGDENFYLNTPTWGDLTAMNAALALFWPSPTLIHMSRYHAAYTSWTEVPVSPEQLQQINAYLVAGFQMDEQGDKQLLPGKGYGRYDDFYRATGSYSCLHTCNSWVNTGLKISGLKACLWTPFDQGVLALYQD